MSTRHPADGGIAHDAAATRDLLAPADSKPATDGIHCAQQTVDPLLIPVRGTVRGPRVEGETCDNGLGTFFIGPDDLDHTYVEDFYTTSRFDAPYSPTGYDDSLIYGFLIRTPADAESAELKGSVDANVAQVGAYDSATSCGYLDFVVTLPIPPGVVCTTPLPPCDPGCAGYGELPACTPAHAKLHYAAHPSAACGTNQEPAQGGWVLTLTSVSPYIPGEGYQHFVTHGNLTATLVNQADPSDSVVLNLDF